MPEKRTNTARWLEKQQRWQINVQRDGERRSFTSSKPGRAGQREANAKADRWLDQGINDEDATVERLWGMWLESKRADMGRGHMLALESQGRQWVLPRIGSMRIGKVTETHLQAILGAMASAGRSRVYISAVKEALGAFIKYARISKCTTLILEDLHVPKSAVAGERTILNPADLRTLFTVSTYTSRGAEVPAWFINAFRLAVLTGLRPGELRGLKPGDRWGKTVTVSRSVNKLEEITPGKNANARRSFVLTPLACSVWDAQLRQLEDAGVSSEWLFPKENGELPTYRLFAAAWKRYRSSAGISDVTLYELRHSFVSIIKSLPEGYLRQLVGHSPAMDSYRTYSHEMDEDAEAAAAMISDIFSRFLAGNQ